SVRLHADTTAQVIEQQNLLCLGQAQLPRNSRVPDRAKGRGSRATAVAADQHHVGMGFRNSGRNRTYADFRDQLYRNARPRIYVLQVVNELRQILDRVDVMVRRWRY